MTQFTLETENEKAYMDADYEVISMVNHKRDSSGQLPRVTLHFVPAERAEAIIALDKRIQVLKTAVPWIIAGTVGILSFLLGTAV